MLNSIFNTIMERRARQIVEQIEAWLLQEGLLMDLGSGTGHLTMQLGQELGVKVIPLDVTDIHVVGQPPILIEDGVLPFAKGTFTTSLLVFMLAYPNDPGGLLAEVARVTHGPIILVQSLYSTPLSYLWLRIREFLWTIVAFHVSKLIGYVPQQAKFTMQAQRFFTAHALQKVVATAGLRICARKIISGRSPIVVGWLLERDE